MSQNWFINLLYLKYVHWKSSDHNKKIYNIICLIPFSMFIKIFLKRYIKKRERAIHMNEFYFK